MNLLSFFSKNLLNAAFFVSFIVIGTFIVINLFVAIIVKKTEEAYRHIQNQSSIIPSQEEILDEIREIKRMLDSLEKKISKGHNFNTLCYYSHNN